MDPVTHSGPSSVCSHGKSSGTIRSKAMSMSVRCELKAIINHLDDIPVRTELQLGVRWRGIEGLDVAHGSQFSFTWSSATHMIAYSPSDRRSCADS